MIETKPVAPVFHTGDPVVLADGPYRDTAGVFLRLKEDVNWAAITERNGTVHSHPIIWLAHSARN